MQNMIKIKNEDEEDSKILIITIGWKSRET